MKQVEQWRQFELTLNGPQDGNPFIDVNLSATFSHQQIKFTVNGFYDGNGIYKIRYMPEIIGEWTVTTNSNVPELNGQTDIFNCIPAKENNHGPVRVSGKTHFAYADGTSFMPVGTTAYAWIFQSPELQKQTLKTLSENQFNKIRMTVFPKYYNYNTKEPALYPYVGQPKKVTGIFNDDSWQVKPEDIGFDFSKFNPKYFQHVENSIAKLDDIGIEADLILFHPYDSWGFARMGEKFDKLYLKYVIARFASYKNVWWALANEYDLMDQLGQKKYAEWDVIGQTVQQLDPSQHLISIHNFYDPPVHKDTTANWYDNSKPWITHLSIQSDNVFFIPKWRKEFQKPVVVDECRYEGNIEFGWGDNTAEGMMDNYWRIVVRGGFATHGETYIDRPNTDRPIWWAHGGILRGQSQLRINFLTEILKKEKISYFNPLATTGPHWELVAGESADKQKVLVYLGENQPQFDIFDFLPKGKKYSATLIDAWNMTTKPMDTDIDAEHYFELPRKKYLALLLVAKKGV